LNNQGLTQIPSWFHSFLKLRWVVVLSYVVLVAFMASFIPQARLDASSDSLTLETDPGLELYREASERYDSGDFFVLAYSPNDGDVLSPKSLADLADLVVDLEKIDGIDNVTSVLNVPLLESPPVGIDALSEDPRTIATNQVNIELVRKEFLTSPLYKQMLLSEDSGTTALMLSLPVDLEYNQLIAARNEILKAKQAKQPYDRAQLNVATKAVVDHRTAQQDVTKTRLENLRAVVAKHSDRAQIFVGGVPMIASDMLSFIRSDITTFGAISVVLMIIALSIFFRGWRWVVVPLLVSASTVVVMSGWLAWQDWRLSVISSNFASLLLIISLAIGIYLSVKFREQVRHGEGGIDMWLWQTVIHMSKPCAYSVLTTLVAFLSLVLSGIRPVMDFGMIMSIGIVLSLITNFLIFPSLIKILGAGKVSGRIDMTSQLLSSWGRWSLDNGRTIYLVTGVIVILSAVGSSRVIVENRFIDYFSSDTEIYKGMALIDQKLGGTTPLEIIIVAPNLDDADDSSFGVEGDDEYADDASGDEYSDDAYGDDEFASDDGFDEGFDEGFGDDTSSTQSWWFSTAGVAELKELTDYLESLEASGKVMSLVTTVEVAEGLNNGPLDDFTLAFLKTVLPDDVRSLIVDPYWHEATDEAKIQIRIVDSTPDLSRKEYVEDILRFAREDMQLGERVQATGLLVLYNNMVQSLFESQIKTLGVVFAGVFVMFLVLFRRVSLALVTLIPNLIAAGAIIGFMGLAQIPLDFMTITIAAIVVGIGVDDCIHYVVCYRDEFAKDGDKEGALIRAHKSIGSAMSYTSWTIVTGFSVLALSNFMPSVAFGLLTSVAMVLALSGALILLPRFLMLLPSSALRY